MEACSISHLDPWGTAADFAQCEVQPLELILVVKHPCQEDIALNLYPPQHACMVSTLPGNVNVYCSCISQLVMTRAGDLNVMVAHDRTKMDVTCICLPQQ